MENPTLDRRLSKTPEPIDIKLDRGDYIGDLTPHANFGISIPGVRIHMREIFIIRVYHSVHGSAELCKGGSPFEWNTPILVTITANVVYIFFV